MEWEKKDKSGKKLPVKSWCSEVEEEAMVQAENLALHPAVDSHVALMADCHVGFGMPIGGVIGCSNAVIPNAVGVDIGCGMAAVETDIPYDSISEKHIEGIITEVKRSVPVGEGRSHKHEQKWDGFSSYLDDVGIDIDDFKSRRAPGWRDKRAWDLALRNLGSLGGGNHFIEIQVSDTGLIWLMLHSGSRNLGYRVANYYHKLALEKNKRDRIELPSSELAFLEISSNKGKAYIRDMNFALDYAAENRKRMMSAFKEAVSGIFETVEFVREINIHHNYAAEEIVAGRRLWIHRKGATSAREGELGIIPGSMGTSSYIVRGLGNSASFNSCSHGAGRVLGRKQACRTLTMEECNRSMEGIVFDGWNRYTSFRSKKRAGEPEFDFGEAPGAYKNIDEVIASQKDLVQPLVKLRPLGVIKG